MTRRPSSVLSRRAFAVGVLACSYALFVGWTVLHSNGIVGATQKNGFGCTCHDFATTDTVVVWIEGPAQVQHGTQASYRLLMTGGPAVEGGFNVAAGRGALAPADGTTKLLPYTDGLELTHVTPKAFAADTVRWDFLYTAPADTTLDTLFSVGNSANGNGAPTGDQWNFGANFVVDVTNDPPSDVAPEGLPHTSALFQNYPNPFNPSTTLRYTVGREGLVELSVFDVRGALVDVPVRQRRSPGAYEVRWDAGALPSGIYFSRLSTPGFTGVRKMLLVR